MVTVPAEMQQPQMANHAFSMLVRPSSCTGGRFYIARPRPTEKTYIIPTPLSYFREGGPQKSKLHFRVPP